MILTKRDELIIDALKGQDFCLYKDIEKSFFSSKYSAYKRLSKLEEKGYIKVRPLKSLLLGKGLDQSCINFIGTHRKYIQLNEKGGFLRRKVSPWKIRHQLLLYSLKERLEDLLKEPAYFEAKLKDLKYTLYDRSTCEPLPDLYFKTKDYKLAIELELHIKSKNRYFFKAINYEKSSFSHVLYVVLNAKKITGLVRDLDYYEYIGITHYLNLKDLTSYWHGNISLLDWLKKKEKKEDKYELF